MDEFKNKRKHRDGTSKEVWDQQASGDFAKRKSHDQGRSDRLMRRNNIALDDVEGQIKDFFAGT